MRLIIDHAVILKPGGLKSRREILSFLTTKDVFGQIVKFTLSEKYSEMKRLLEGLIEKPEVPEKIIIAA